MLGKKIIRGFFCALLLIIGVMAAGNLGQWKDKQEVSAASLSLYATSAVLMDADTGRVLYGKASDVPMAMASTTKIMTCILVLENGNLEDVVEVSSYAASMPKVKLYVHKGEEYRVKDLLYSLMLESHNDSAVVLAEYIGKKILAEEQGEVQRNEMQQDVTEPAEYITEESKSAEYTTEESKQAVEAFAGLMNQKAEELGCKDTWFITPNGLDATQTFSNPNGESIQKEHHTTAEELAKVMSYCIKKSPQKEAFLQITGTADYSFTANGRSFSCVNHNAFLHMMEGAVSGKTGFTNKAGYCYVGALERDGRTYVVALLACGWPSNKSYKWSDTRELMEYGVENYFYHSLSEESEELGGKKLHAIMVEEGRTDILGQTALAEVEKTATGKGVEGLLLREGETVDISLHQKKKLQAPVQKGMTVGYVCYSVDDTIYRVEDIVTTQEVERISRGWCLEQVIQRFLLEKKDYRELEISG